MQRRVFNKLMLGSLALPSAILAACSGTANTPTKPSGPVKFALANDKSAWSPFFNKIGDYMASKYQYGFQSQAYQDTSVYQGVIRSASSTSKSPPLFTWWSGYQLRELVKAGSVADLTPNVQQWIKDYGMNEGIAKAFAVDGKYYAAPLNLAYWTTFYNKKAFADNGLKPPTTWQDLMDICETLKGKGVTPFGIYAAPQWTGFIWLENLLLASDPDLYENLMIGKAKYTDSGVVEVMKLWKSLADKGYFKVMNANDPPKDLVNGKVAMVLFGQWWESTLIEAGMKADTDFDIFIMPSYTAGLGPQLVFEAGPIAASAKSPNKEQAIQALNNFMRTDVQQKWVEMTNFVSVESAVPTTGAINKRIDDTIKAQNVALHNRYWEATPPQIAVPASEALTQMVLHPESYMDVLQKCQTIADQYWSTQQ